MSLRKTLKLSERAFSIKCKLSRLTVRQIEDQKNSVTIDSITKISSTLDRELIVLLCPTDSVSDYSTVAVSMKVIQDGFESWKIHFLEMVDEYRRTLDPRLLILAPHSSLDKKLKALLASIVSALCEETQIDPPSWSKKNHFLETPWFVAESEALKASSCLESPIWFRRNNIFVLSNFLQRV